MAGEAAEVLASAQWRMAGVRDQAQQTLASLAGSRADRAGLDDPAGTSGKETGFGRRFEVNIPITGPNGRRGTLLTVWQFDEGSTTPRMITNLLKVHR